MGRHDDVLVSIYYGAVPLTAANLAISAPAQSPRTNRVVWCAQELGPAIGPFVESQPTRRSIRPRGSGEIKPRQCPDRPRPPSLRYELRERYLPLAIVYFCLKGIIP